MTTHSSGKSPASALRALAFAAVMFVTGAAALIATTAASFASETIFLKYDLYAHGIRIAVLKFDIQLSGDSYTITTKMKTKGIADLFSSSSFGASTQGTYSASGADPSQFALQTEASGPDRSTVVTWGGSQPPHAERNYHVDAYKLEDVASALAANVIDPVSALLGIMLGSPASLCSGGNRVHDGKLVYDLTFTRLQRDDFGSNDAGVYRGEAHQCQIEYLPVAGLSRDKQEKLRAENSNGLETHKLWLAPVQSATLGRTIFIPVGAVGVASGTQVVLYLNGATISGQPLNSQSVAQR